MPQHINREEKERESDFNQIVLNSLLSNVLLNPVNFSSIHYIFRYINLLHASRALRIISWYFFKCINIKIYFILYYYRQYNILQIPDLFLKLYFFWGVVPLSVDKMVPVSCKSYG
jgi:hypothetical protein